jgi:hypothetical protein
MTCEVAVMNKHGIALAADSAVTLGAGEKIYHGAEKLFQLSPSTSIGVMTYGNADLMGVPWEIVIKSYGWHRSRRLPMSTPSSCRWWGSQIRSGSCRATSRPWRKSVYRRCSYQSSMVKATGVCGAAYRASAGISTNVAIRPARGKSYSYTCNGGRRCRAGRPLTKNSRAGKADGYYSTASLQNPKKIIECFQQLGGSATPKKES